MLNCNAIPAIAIYWTIGAMIMLQKKFSQWPDLVSTALTAGTVTTRLRGLGTLLNLRLAVILGLPKIIGYIYIYNLTLPF